MQKEKLKHTDKELIEKCIKLAKKGKGLVSPNPLVGCVITKNGKVISEGYHKKYGSTHAEIQAINSALKKKIKLKSSTLYVNLEPCFHFGKTPPCINEIIKHKFKKVIIGTRDPNPLVSGKSIKKLKRNKIEVLEGVCKKECQELNKFFFKHITKGLPYITLKLAQTLDGKIADEDYKSKWISSFKSRKTVHLMRSEFDAVLVGKNTAAIDNPSLTVRHVKGRNPYRIVVDNKLSLNNNLNLFTDRFKEKTIVIATENAKMESIKELERKKIKFILSKPRGNLIDLKDAMKKLSKIGIISVLVEGGSFTASEFLKQGLVDEIVLFISPKILGKGLSAFQLENEIDLAKAQNITFEYIDKDILVRIKL